MGFFSKVFKKIKNVVKKVATVAAPVLTFAAPFLAPISAGLSTFAAIGGKIAGGINTVSSLSSFLKGGGSSAAVQYNVASATGNTEAQNTIAREEIAKNLNPDAILQGQFPKNIMDTQLQLQYVVGENQKLAAETLQALEAQKKAETVPAELQAQQEILAAQERAAAASAAQNKDWVMLAGVALVGLYFLSKKG